MINKPTNENPFSLNKYYGLDPDDSPRADGFHNIGNPSDSPTSYPENMPVSRHVREKKQPINFLLVIGVIFILVAGTIFATTTWQSMTNGLRCAVLFFSAVVFYGLSALSRRAFSLNRSAAALYTLASSFLTISMFSLGFLGILGESFESGGVYCELFRSASMLPLIVSAFVGVKLYNSKIYAWISLFAAEIMLMLFSKGIFGGVRSAEALNLAIVALLVAICAELPHVKEYKHYGEILPLFATVNSLVIVVYSLIITDNSLLAGIAFICLSLSLLSRPVRSQSSDAGVGIILFVFCFIAGLYKIITPDKANGVLLICCFTIVLLVIMTEIEIFTTPAKKLLNISTVILISCSIVYSALLLTGNNSDWDYLTGIMLLVMSAAIGFSGIKNKNKVILSLAPMLLLFDAIRTTEYITFNTQYLLLLRTGVFAALGVAFVLIKPVRTKLSDILFALALFCLSVSGFASDFPLCAAVPFAVYAAYHIFLCIRSKGQYGTVQRYVLAVMSFFSVVCVHRVVVLLNGAEIFPQLLFAYELIMLAASVVLLLKAGAKRIISETEVVPLLIAIFCMTVSYDAKLPFISVYAVYSLFRAFMTKKKSKNAADVYFYIALAAIPAALSRLCTVFGLTFSDGITLVTVCSVVYFLLYLLIRITETDIGFNKQFALFNSCAMPLSLFFYVLSFSSLKFSSVFAVCLCIFAFGAAIGSAYFVKYNYGIFIVPLLAYYMIYRLLEFNGETTAYRWFLFGIFLLLLVGGMLMREAKKKLGRSSDIDFFTISAILSPFMLLASAQGNALLLFGARVMLAVYPLMFIRKSNTASKRVCGVASITLFCLAFSLISGSLSEPYDVFARELLLTPWIIWGILFRAVEKKRYPFGSFALSLAAVLISTVILNISACFADNAFHAVYIGFVSAVMVIASFMYHRKRWFAIGLSSLIVVTISKTLQYWNSFEWWVYLLATGVLLIIFASINEYSKKKGRTLKESAAKYISDWKW